MNNAFSRADERVKADRARQKQVQRVKAQWVLDTEMTAEQHREQNERMRLDFYAREARRAA